MHNTKGAKAPILKCSDFVKKNSSLVSLKEFSELSGIQVRTLQNWYEKNQRAFICMMVGAMCEKDSVGNSKEWGCD